MEGWHAKQPRVCCTHLDKITLIPALCATEVPRHSLLQGVTQDKQQERGQHRKGHQLGCWAPGTQLAGRAGAEGCQGEAQRCVVHAFVLQADRGDFIVGLHWGCWGIGMCVGTAMGCYGEHRAARERHSLVLSMHSYCRQTGVTV